MNIIVASYFYDFYTDIINIKVVWLCEKIEIKSGEILISAFRYHNTTFYLLYAMDEWEEATDGAVKFYEKPLNWWGRIKWGMGICRNVRIKKDHYGIGNSLSWGTLGNLPWSRIWINLDRIFRLEDLNSYHKGWRDDRSWTHATLIHELGHIIGLDHEFARSDRDECIEITTNPDYSKFARFWERLTVVDYGSYDYKSCMNYSGFYKIKGTNREIEFKDINKISHNDVLSVKYLYSRISYRELLDNWQETKSILLGDGK